MRSPRYGNEFLSFCMRRSKETRSFSRVWKWKQNQIYPLGTGERHFQAARNQCAVHWI
nr:MAG TPA: hypothetical protein [Caudoviricetes sp.]DAX27257.1 MAG TPA: hypothetical protein [Caudoviricetes sp.]DAX94502.1 MAG TPA: hypothetical protein [Caudoviricetes sp.]